MNEALTRAQLIDPVLIDKGWKAGFCQECYWIPEEVFPGCPAPEKVVEFYGNLQESLYAVGRIVGEAGSGA